MKRLIFIILTGVLFLLLTACGKDTEGESTPTSAKKESEDAFAEASIEHAHYIAQSHVEETSADENKELLIIELDITNTYEEEISVANSQDVKLVDGDEEIDAITIVHQDFGVDRQIDIGVDETKEHIVAFPVEIDKIYEIAIYPQVVIEAEEPIIIPLDTKDYADSFEKLQNPAKAITAYVEEIYLDIDHPDFDDLVAANKEKLQHKAEEAFYKNLDRSSVHGFPKEDSEEVYHMFRNKLAQEASIETDVRENMAGEAIVDFTYQTLSLDKLRDLMSEYETEYHDSHDGFDPVKANEYAVSKIDGIIDQLETVSGEWKVQMIEKDGKWELDPSDFKSDAILNNFVDGEEYGD